VQALDRVRLEIVRGQVHALMGENGAGKSTLMKILSGFHQPDSGQIWVKGQPVRVAHPHAALRLGIAMIQQELLPFPELSVAENIYMGRQPASRFLGWIDHRQMEAAAQRLLESLGLAVPPARPMKELSVSEMQVVEIAKALAHQAEVIIMDEPTSAISAPEVEALVAIIRELQHRGVAVVYVSHRMDEVFRLADTVTVLRDGRHVTTLPIGALDRDKLIALMVGRELAEVFPPASATPGEVVLAVRGLSRAGKFRDITFTVRRGEVLGLAGLMGAGRTEVAYALFGLAPAEAGQIEVRARSLRITTPKEAMANGIGLVTEDRRRYGLAPEMSVKHNLTLANLRQCCWAGFINHPKESRLADEQIRAFAIKTADRDQVVGHLSGGNQQKVVLAKALLADPEVLILDEPTRGIDIGAKAEVYALIRKLARAGKAMILISSELPEVLALSHRLLVMREGLITAELDPKRTTPEEVMKHAMPP
jgi:inositol transport system ATP-binding protein